MKNAVCIYGEMRSFDYEYINEFYKNFDVFLHTHMTTIDSSVDMQHLFKLKNLKGLSVDQSEFKYPKHIYNSNNIPISTPNNIAKMLYSISKSIQLKTNYEKFHDFEYDKVLIVRNDVSWNKINFSDLFDGIILEDFSWNGNARKDWYMDHFILTTSRISNKIENFFNYFRINWPEENINFLLPKQNFIAEIIWKNFLDSLNEQVKFVRFSYDVKAIGGGQLLKICPEC
jgi:hypothetical protein